MSEITAVPIRPIARGSVAKLWIALAVLALAAAALAWWGTAAFQEIALPSGVRYRAIAEGRGPTITSADVAVLRYKLHVGSVEAPVIQDSDESGQPFVTTVAEVFPGFGEGLQKMRAGGTYILSLPPGTHATAPPPPGAPFGLGDTLVFELSILQIGAGMAAQRQMQQMQQMQQQMQMQQGGAPDGGANGPAGPPAPPPGGGR